MNRFTQIVAYGYSVLLYPLFVPTYLMILFCVLQSKHVLLLAPAYCALAIGGTCFFTCIIPLIVLLTMRALGRVKDLDVSKKEERTEPFIYTLISLCFWCYFLHLIYVPAFLFWSAIATVAVLLLVMAITLRWKISAHLASAGGALAMVIGMILEYGIEGTGIILLLLFLSWLLMLARIYLDAHTPLQTVCGFLLGLIAVLIPNIILHF